MHLVCFNICEADKIVGFGNPYKTLVLYFQGSNTEQGNASLRVHVVLEIDFQML